MASKFFCCFFSNFFEFSFLDHTDIRDYQDHFLFRFTCCIDFFARTIRLKPLARVCITHCSDHNDHFLSYSYKDSYLPFDRTNLYFLCRTFHAIFFTVERFFDRKYHLHISIYLWTFPCNFHGLFQKFLSYFLPTTFRSIFPFFVKFLSPTI